MHHCWPYLVDHTGDGPRVRVQQFTVVSADTLLNLGTLLWREGRRDEARAYFSRFLAEAPEEQYAEDRARVLAQLDARGRTAR
jgi:Tfp pilus assembly protein PilF